MCSFKLYFRSDKESKKNPAPRTFDIFICQEVLGIQICNILLLLHAYTGCNSTSKISKITKPAVFKKLISNETYLAKFCMYAELFSTPNQPSDIIEKYVIETMKLLFGGTKEESLAVF